MNDEPVQDSSSSRLQNVVVLIQGMSAQLSALQLKVDERLYDTRPLWESAQGQINDLRFDMEQGLREFRADMGQGFQLLRADIEQGNRERRAESNAETEKLRTELSRELRYVGNSLDALHGKMLRYDTIQRDIENRVRDIEAKTS